MQRGIPKQMVKVPILTSKSHQCIFKLDQEQSQHASRYHPAYPHHNSPDLLLRSTKDLKSNKFLAEVQMTSSQLLSMKSVRRSYSGYSIALAWLGLEIARPPTHLRCCFLHALAQEL